MAGQSKKQGCVSHSTPESELVAADHTARTFGIPSADLWSLLLSRPSIEVKLHEDNETAIVAMRQGYSNAMRHLERTHGISLRSLAEHVNTELFKLLNERAALQRGDIFTKGFNRCARLAASP